MKPTLKPSPRAWLGLVLMVGFLLATNRWMSWEEGARELTLVDVTEGYQLEAEAAPGWPTTLIPFNKAQRFPWHYLVGSTARVVGITPVLLYQLLLPGLHLLLFWGTWVLLRRRCRSETLVLLGFAAFVWQPYAIRYYWLAPGMSGDVVSELGTILILLGAFGACAVPQWLGFFVGTACRQTTLMLFPGLVWQHWKGEEWRAASPGKRLASLAGSAAVWLAVYLFTSRVAASFASPFDNASAMYDFFKWALSPAFSVPVLLEHSLRSLLPLALPLVLLCLAEHPKRWQSSTWALVLMSLATASQPFLGGPISTGQNAGRLATLGLLPAILAWIGEENREALARSWPLWCALALGSLHHVYTRVGPGSAIGSAGLQLLAVAVAAGVSWRSRTLAKAT